MQNKEKFIGKHILVGLTYLDKNGKIKEKIQLHGTIKNISKNTLIFEKANNRSEFSIPFDKDSIEPGQPGAIYKLKSTGEAVENVDFISSWTIRPPKNKDL